MTDEVDGRPELRFVRVFEAPRDSRLPLHDGA